MAKNNNMNSARKNKNDEFYTMLSDIEREVHNYKDFLNGKVVYLNCDDPEWSNFFRFFASNFEYFNLKKLISTHYSEERASYKIELDRALNPREDGTFVEDINEFKTPLMQNGDFRSPECVEILKSVDVVITNPPFSLFREYIAQIIEHDKKFLVIGNMNAINYKEIFPLIKNNQIWLGYNSNKTMEFRLPDSYLVYSRIENGNKIGKVPSISWFTNIPNDKRNDELTLYMEYDETKFDKFDNYNAINVNKVSDIPKDYYGEMGVPITFMDKYNPNQFEIVDLMDRYLLIQDDKNKELAEKAKNDPKNRDSLHRMTSVKGKPVYSRILIKRKVDNI